MAEDNHTPPVIPTPPSRADAFELLDAIDQAKTNLKGTIGLMSLVVDTDREYDEGVVATLERHVLADVAALDAAFAVAWDRLVRSGGAT